MSASCSASAPEHDDLEAETSAEQLRDPLRPMPKGLIGSSILRMNFKDAKREFERQFLLARIAENDGNISKTAEQIGMERSHLHRKIKAID